MAQTSVINFGKAETASVLINVFIIKIFLGLPWELAKNAGTAGWMVSIISGAIFFVLLYFILKIYEKNEEYDILDLCEKACGKTFKKIFAVIVSVSFIVKGTLCLFVTSDILVTVLPFDLPNFVCMFWLIVAAFFCAWRGLEGIVRLHALFLPLILAAFLFTVLAAFKNADITNIFPIFGFGFKNIAKSSLKYVGIYSDLIYVFLLAPHVKNKKIYKKACLGGMGIAAIVITAVVFSYNFAVSYPMSAKLLMPIYQVSRFLKTAANSQGFEAFLLPEWIISSLLYISMSVFYASNLLTDAFNIKKDKIFTLPAAVLIFLLAFIPESLSKASDIGVKYVNVFVILVSLAAVVVNIAARKRTEKSV